MSAYEYFSLLFLISIVAGIILIRLSAIEEKVDAVLKVKKEARGD